MPQFLPKSSELQRSSNDEQKDSTREISPSGKRRPSATYRVFSAGTKVTPQTTTTTTTEKSVLDDALRDLNGKVLPDNNVKAVVTFVPPEAKVNGGVGGVKSQESSPDQVRESLERHSSAQPDGNGYYMQVLDQSGSKSTAPSTSPQVGSTTTTTATKTTPIKCDNKNLPNLEDERSRAKTKIMLSSTTQSLPIVTDDGVIEPPIERPFTSTKQ